MRNCGWRFALFCLALTAAATRLPPTPPRRVVSFNQCADQLVLALADPEQIAGLSPYAADPIALGRRREGARFPRLDWQAESTIALRPIWC